MRKLIGIKYWVNQCTVGSDDSHNSEVGLCPTIFQEENSKHGHTAMVKGQTNKKRKALPEVPGVEGKELNGLNSDKDPTPYIIVMPKPTQVTQEYHRQEHKQIIGQRYMGDELESLSKNPSFSSPDEIAMPAIISNFRVNQKPA
ncbi:hypothetical protein IQ5_07279 [Streptococcus thermophilus MTCC 5460]|nr:hypothetical protein IQ5_07279 [Streptococcus thermophilus MTCC 5460]